MKIESFAFQYAEEIPSRFTCDGENINPELIFKDVPEETKSLAFIMDDPDAPSGTWVHWVMWNIPPDTMEISQDSAPKGATVVGMNSSKQNAYQGPCPPFGTHRYFFKLYALDTLLTIKPASTKADLLTAMEGHIIEETELIGLYERK